MKVLPKHTVKPLPSICPSGKVPTYSKTQRNPSPSNYSKYDTPRWQRNLFLYFVFGFSSQWCALPFQLWGVNKISNMHVAAHPSENPSPNPIRVPVPVPKNGDQRADPVETLARGRHWDLANEARLKMQHIKINNPTKIGKGLAPNRLAHYLQPRKKAF